MRKSELKHLLNIKINMKALSYLLERRKSKGGNIKNEKLEMSTYLLPNSYNMSIDVKKLMWSIRNMMVDIRGNFS